MKLLFAVLLFLGLFNYDRFIIDEPISKTNRQTIICPGQTFHLGDSKAGDCLGGDTSGAGESVESHAQAQRSSGEDRQRIGKTAEVSAYTSRVQETDDSPEIAANGQNIWHLYQKGIKTCASNDYKFGTVIRIEGLGECVIADRMNRRYTGKGNIDFYFGYDLKSALKFGRRTLKIEVIKS